MLRNNVLIAVHAHPLVEYWLQGAGQGQFRYAGRGLGWLAGALRTVDGPPALSTSASCALRVRPSCGKL